jgi:hypothetical protein
MNTRISLIAALLVAVPATASVPDVVTYAGTLRQGNASANGTFSVAFELFDALEDGSRLFSQNEASLPVTAGELVVDLGADPLNPLSDEILSAPALFLAVTVNGETLEPRVPFTSVPYARRAASADDAATLGGLTADDIANISTPGPGLVKNGNAFALAANGVTSVEIADGAIAAADLADGSVTAKKLAAAAVGSDELALGSVTAAHLDTAVTIYKVSAAAAANCDNVTVGDLTTAASCDAGSCSPLNNEPVGCICGPPAPFHLRCGNTEIGKLVK